MPNQWATFLTGLEQLTRPIVTPRPRAEPEQTDNRPKRGRPKGSRNRKAERQDWLAAHPRPEPWQPGQPRPAEQLPEPPRPTRGPLRKGDTRPAHWAKPGPKPKPPVDSILEPDFEALPAWLGTTKPRVRPVLTRQPTLLEAYLARHPEAPEELWAAVPEAPDNPEPQRGRPRKGQERQRRDMPRVCECGNPSSKTRGSDYRCARCREMEAGSMHLGEPDYTPKAKRPEVLASGYVDRANYKAAPGVVPNLGPEHFESPGLQRWIRLKGRLRASEIRQWPTLSLSSYFARKRE